MRKWNSLLFIALVAMLYALPSHAQTDSARKCFEIEGTSDYFFGAIEQDIPVEHTFLFKNNCSDTTVIENARASCGCTAAVVSEKVIAPGKEAKIQVKFTPPKGTRGKVSKTVSVYLKGNPQPHTVLRFSADVKSDFDIQPSYIQLLAAEIGKETTGKATVKNVSTEEIEITETPIAMTSYADTLGNGQTTAIQLPNAKATISKTKLKPNESADILVSLTPMYKGQVNGSIRVKTKKNEVMIQVFGVVRGKDEAAPGDKKPANLPTIVSPQGVNKTVDQPVITTPHKSK